MCVPTTLSPQQPRMGRFDRTQFKQALIRQQAHFCLITGSERAKNLDQPFWVLAKATCGGLQSLQRLFSNDAPLRRAGKKFSSIQRQWQLTPELLPGKSHGQRSLVGCSPWGRQESDTTKRLHFHFSLSMHWRRKWQPTPVFLPGESQGQGSLVGCCLWGLTESDTTEAT